MIRPTMSHALNKDDLHELMSKYSSYLEDELAKANERVHELEEENKELVQEASSYTFYSVKQDFSDELNKFALEQRQEAVEEYKKSDEFCKLLDSHFNSGKVYGHNEYYEQRRSTRVMNLQDINVTLKFTDLDELIYALEPAERLYFLESLACQDEILEHVMEQVFEGYTSNEYMHGWDSYSWNGSTPLQVFKKKMFEVGAIPEMNKYVELLEREIKRNEETIEELRNEIYKLKGIDVGDLL